MNLIELSYFIFIYSGMKHLELKNITHRWGNSIEIETQPFNQLIFFFSSPVT